MIKLAIKYHRYAVLAGALFFMTGCLRDLTDTADELGNIKSVKWNPELAIPLIKTELTPADLLKQYNIDEVRGDQEGLLHFIYENGFVSERADEIFRIPDQTNSFSFVLGTAGAAALQTSGSFSGTLDVVLDFSIADIEVDSMIAKTCDHIVQMTSDLQHNINVDVQFPDVRRNNTPFSVAINSSYSGSPHNVTRNSDLSQYHFDFTNGSQGYNQLRVHLEFVITRSGSNPVSATDFIAFNNQVNNVQYSVVWGLGKSYDLFQTKDSIEITIFSQRQQGSFMVVEPRFVVTFGNSFGTDIEGNVFNLTTWNPDVGDEVLTGIPSPLPIPSPTNAQIGQTLYDSVVLDNSTSNIANVINNMPHGVYYDLSAVLNPATSARRGFVLDSSRFRTNLFVDIPLHGTARDFVLQRIQDFDLEIDSSIDDIEYALFRINVDNGFPVDLGLQLYFEMDDGTIVDSMFVGPLDIATGSLDGSGRISASTKTTEDVKVSQDKYHRLQRATKMRVWARIETPFNGGGTQDIVKFYSDYRLGLKIGVQTKLSIISN